MAAKKDWIPRKESELVPLMTFWRTQLGQLTVRNDFGWDMDDCYPVIAAITAFFDALDAYKAAPTNGNREYKDDLKAAAVEKMRAFARTDIRFNKIMTVPQKREYGVREADTEPTPIAPPAAGPESEIAIDARMPGVVRISYRDAKPYGVDRIEIAYSVSETPIESPALLTQKDSFTRNPWEHTFTPGERRKKLYYALRYLVKNTGSAWSPVEEAVIP